MRGDRWVFRLCTLGQIFNYYFYGYATKAEELIKLPRGKDRSLMGISGAHGAVRGSCDTWCGIRGVETGELNNKVTKPMMIGTGWGCHVQTCMLVTPCCLHAATYFTPP